MKVKLASLTIHLDEASNLILDTEFIPPMEIKKAFTQDQIEEGSLGTIMAVLNQFIISTNNYSEDVSKIIKDV